VSARNGWGRWADPSAPLPVDVLPRSNGEFVPPPPTRRQLGIMRLAEAETERWRRRTGMSRRDFVRTAGALAIGFWAIDTLSAGRFGSYRATAHNTGTTDACDLEWAGRDGYETLGNLPGEFVFDVQTHHVEPDGMWRVNNPAIHAFFAVVWPQSSAVLGDQPEVRPDGSVRGGGAGEIDPIANLSRFHYLKELYLDSATNVCVLSAVPTGEDWRQPLPMADAATTVHTVNELARSPRAVMHAFVMPNRGSGGRNDPRPKGQRTPLFLAEELALMTERAKTYRGFLRGWKTYPAWGDVPYASGWFLDDQEMGLPFIEHVREVSRQVPEVPPIVASHKGFALPGFDQAAAAPRDVGVAARQFPDVKFLIYHSGYDTGTNQGPYPGDVNVDSSTRSVDALIKSLRENGWDATTHVEPGKTFGNSPNVYAELGSVWSAFMDDPDKSAHLIGKLIRYVGPKRVIWGTDALWGGSPQALIVALRRFEFTDAGKELYGLPYGLEGDVEDPTQPAPDPTRTIRNAILGRNAADAYRVNPATHLEAIRCDQVNAIREEYITNPTTLSEAAPQRTNDALGPRTRRELFAMRAGKPWAP
jgi:predicted TIM-barrel fold metal-dependent hydrolase